MISYALLRRLKVLRVLVCYFIVVRKLIANNASAFDATVNAGGVLITNNLIIKRHKSPTNQKANRCIELLFSKMGDYQH